MTELIPVDAARLRAAVADNRYWQAGHPERDGWRAWVGKGFETLYGPGNSAGAAVVHVRAYIRNGHQVAAHT